MSAEHSARTSSGSGVLKKVYVLLIFFMGLTGFAQMPIFKRYYIADIPGLGWLADFYFTHTLHYLGAIVLLSLFAYYIMQYLLLGKRIHRLTATAYIRMVFLAGLVGTGIVRVLKNLPDVSFSPAITLFVDIAHLGFMMTFMVAAFFFFIFKRGWVVERHQRGGRR